MKVGVLSLQGDIEDHLKILTRCGSKGIAVKSCEEIKGVDGLIIPGGESTTIGKLLSWYGIDKVLIELTQKGLPIYGTCAGLILLAKRINPAEQSKLALMNIVVRRNAFGRQRESFEADLDIPILGAEPFRAIFIRAPYIVEVSEEVEILATFNNKIVFARQNNLLVSAFHPELTGDIRLHQYFLSMIK